jgi:hypothetical protein
MRFAEWDIEAGQDFGVSLVLKQATLRPVKLLG